MQTAENHLVAVLKEGDHKTMSKCALTTIDNPYNPFNQFDLWYQYDMDKGYSSCSYLDRVSYTSDSLSEEENDREIERAIDEIIKYDFMGIYKKITQ